MRRHALSDRARGDGSDVPQQQPRTREARQRGQPGRHVEPNPYRFDPAGPDGAPVTGVPFNHDHEITYNADPCVGIEAPVAATLREPDPSRLANLGERIIGRDLGMLDRHNRAEAMDQAPAARLFDLELLAGVDALDALNLDIGGRF